MHPFDIETQARRLVNPSSNSPRFPVPFDHHRVRSSSRAALAETLRRVADRLDN